jgi:ABC-type multidrug transport system fused ATPase/permease subunit
LGGKYISELKNSLYHSAFKKLLQIDPIYHSTKSLGAALSKIDRGSIALENFSFLMFYEIIPFLVGLTTVIFSLISSNLWLGLSGLGFLTIIVGLSCFWYLKYGNIIEEKINLSEGNLKSVAVESLSQVSFIRATFATLEQIKKIESRSQKFIKQEALGGFQYITCNQLVQLVYRLSLFSLSAFVIYLISRGQMNAVTGSTLILTYLAGTNSTWSIGDKVRRTMQSYIRIKDLFAYAKEYGQQSFPVLNQNNNAD